MEKSFKFYKAFLIQWLTFGWLCGVMLSICFVFYNPVFDDALYPVDSKWGGVVILSLIFVAILYEWSSIKSNGFMQSLHNKIYKKFLPRISFLSPKAAVFDSWVLVILILTIILFSVLSWIYPHVTTWSNWVVGICAASLGNYALREQNQLSQSWTNSLVFYSSATVFFITLLFFFVLTISGHSYDTNNKEPHIFIITASAWFSFGILGALIPGLLNRVRDRYLAET
ncbi:hypothetical protein ACA874_004171 [Vibrio vulnificus]|nr:hypothetical protein [Vibrio vulnificus]HDY7590099.1 hypothetical protein [Vibrio vulnificus]